ETHSRTPYPSAKPTITAIAISSIELDCCSCRPVPARDKKMRSVLIHFAFERGYVVENVTGRDAGEHDIAPTPFAQPAADLFPRRTGHRRKIGQGDPFLEHKMSLVGWLSDVSS